MYVCVACCHCRIVLMFLALSSSVGSRTSLYKHYHFPECSDWSKKTLRPSSAKLVSMHLMHAVPYFQTPGSLTCAQLSMHAIAHGGLRTLVRESALKADSGIKWEEKNLSHRGIEPASAACWSDALPTELHPHRSFTDNDMYTALTLTCSQYRHSHVYSTYSHMKTILTMKHKQITQHWQWYELMN